MSTPLVLETVHNGAKLTVERLTDGRAIWSVRRPGDSVSGDSRTLAAGIARVFELANLRDETGALSFAGDPRNAR